MKKNIQLKEAWKNVLQDEFKENYIRHLKQFLIKEKVNYTIYPRGEDIFNAFNTTPFNNVKVVILGQDPYHGKGQAHGLSFSVPNEVKTPPSLVNIFKEIDRDLGIKNYGNGNLTKWAKQGVLLLNSTLTVRKDEAGSHQNKGW
ncbi:MAG TPA: uracil-DNA glycosylase, partial [Flavobacteriales bacterium]|nr:uracil-DNA glycosylase [Flavobacteriales bacterium]